MITVLPHPAGDVDDHFALGSLIPLEPWDILIARRFLQLGKT